MNIIKAACNILRTLFCDNPQNWYRGNLNLLESEIANNEIASAIYNGKPFMVARIGSVEIKPTLYFSKLEQNSNFHNATLYTCGNADYVLDKKQYLRYIENIMRINAGFFPSNENTLRHFASLMMNDIKEIDICGAWLNEYLIKDAFSNNAKFCKLEDLEPYEYENPWSMALKGKKVLVIHPFSDSITKQYQKRKEIWTAKEILPDFELSTITAVQSISSNEVPFRNWFEALDYMEFQMDSIEYDVAIIGCGAYGLPLAAHAKKTGHIGIHLGGPVQILFGIKGNRWDNIPSVSKYYNEHWVRPSKKETPESINAVEGACYW